jgi:hypothetical protein
MSEDIIAFCIGFLIGSIIVIIIFFELTKIENKIKILLEMNKKWKYKKVRKKNE